MKIDLARTLKDFTGTDITFSDKQAVPTLGEWIVIAIKSTLSGDEGLPMDRKLDLERLGSLAFKKSDTMTSEQISMAKERICKCFPAPAIAGAVHRAFEEA